MSTDLTHPSSAKPWLFKPGQSGNLGGSGGRRPSLITALYKELSKPGKTLKTQNDEVAAEIVRLALESKSDEVRVKAITEIMNRLHGRPHQSIAVTSTNDEEFQNMVQLFINECQRLGLESNPEDAEVYLSETVIEIPSENVKVEEPECPTSSTTDSETTTKTSG